MSRTRTLMHVDVFGRTALSGNPLAVVLDADGLDAGTMQTFASWMNLSETAFVLPTRDPSADYRVRIFTPSTELPFAGHPTLGTAAAWLAAGGRPGGEDVVQECGSGLVRVRRDGDTLAFAAPPLVRYGPMDSAHVAACARALGVGLENVRDHSWVDNGSAWCVLDLGSADAVLAIEPDYAAIPGAKVAVAGAFPAGAEHAYEVRAFVAAGYEDPVTGSLQAGLAQWMLDRGEAAAPFTAHQGTRCCRDGVVRLDQADGQVWIGGTATVVAHGRVTL